MTTTSTFASPPAAPLPASHQVGEILSEILHIHTDPALDGCNGDPPLTSIPGRRCGACDRRAS